MSDSLSTHKTQGFSTQYYGKSPCFSFKHLIMKNRAKILGTVSAVACCMSSPSERKGFLCMQVQWSQAGKRHASAHLPIKDCFPRFFLLLSTHPLLSHSQGCFLNQQAAQREGGRAARKFLMGEGRETASSPPGCLQIEGLV